MSGTFSLPYIDPAQRPMVFPAVDCAWPSSSPAPGILAWGGDLSVERLMLAYAQGIFPWFSADDPILWWSTDPRMVVYPSQFRLKRSLRKVLRQFLRTSGCEIRLDCAFAQVIKCCSEAKRPGQGGTWILPQMQQAYLALHERGVAHSFESWVDGRLVGGLYGVSLGKMFYGESMFTHHTDASKLAFCALMAFARFFRMPLVDCQQKTQHLASLGGVTISRARFVAEMEQARQQPSPPWPVGVFPADFWAALLPDGIG